MNKREKTLIIIAIVLGIALGIKSFVTDDYKPKNESEELFKEKIENIVKEKYNSTIFQKNIVVIRVVKISEMSEKEKTVSGKKDEIIIASGKYKAKIRKYILGYLPFAEERIRDIKSEEKKQEDIN